MAWIGVAGAAIAGAVGGSVAATAVSAYVIGGIVIGAVVGAVYQGVTDGNILKGMLYGAIGGAAVGGAGYALYGGVAAAGAGGAVGGAGGSIGVGMGSASLGTTSGLAGGTTVSTAGLASGSQLAVGVGTGASTASSGFLSSLSTTSTIVSMASLGKEFLAGGMSGQDEVDKDWEREKMDRQSAENAKELENRLKIAGLQRGGAGNSAALQYKAASEQLAFEKQKFREEFDEQKRQFDVSRGDELGAKERFQKSVEQGGAYASGQAQTISLVEINRQRKELPNPPWMSGKSVNKTSPVTQPQVG